jgi:hypothetical protein
VCSAVQTFGDAVTELEDSLQELGKPSTDDGKKAKNAVANLEKELKSDVDAIEQLLTPPPSEPSEIASTFAEIGSTIQKAVSQTKSTANTLKGLKPNGTLQKAFQSSPDCKQLKSSS